MFNVVENPGVLSGVEIISEIEILTKVVFKNVFSALAKSAVRIFSLNFNPFPMGFFLIERSKEDLLSCKEWAIFDIWEWSYSAPKFENVVLR